MNHTVGQDFGSAPPHSGNPDHRPARSRPDLNGSAGGAAVFIIGTLLAEWFPTQFAFPATSTLTGSGSRTRAAGLRLPGFPPTLAALGMKTRARPLLLSRPTPVWSQNRRKANKNGRHPLSRNPSHERSTFMAHEIDINNGVASFASRTDAWHRLGQTVGHTMTAEEALSAAHLSGWSVHKRRLVAPLEPVITDDDGVTTLAPLPVADHFATVRTNPITGNFDVLGVVGSKYEPVQNEETCALLNVLTDESGAVFETAGALRGGREVFVTMKLPQSMTFDGKDGSKDRTDFYLAALNSHDGSG